MMNKKQLISKIITMLKHDMKEDENKKLNLNIEGIKKAEEYLIEKILPYEKYNEVDFAKWSSKAYSYSFLTIKDEIEYIKNMQ